LGVSFTFVDEMWLWGEMVRLDSVLHFYGVVFHSH